MTGRCRPAADQASNRLLNSPPRAALSLGRVAQGAVVKELGGGADTQPLHVVLSKLAASTERMNDDVAYLLIGARTMLSDRLVKEMFSEHA